MKIRLRTNSSAAIVQGILTSVVLQFQVVIPLFLVQFFHECTHDDWWHFVNILIKEFQQPCLVFVTRKSQHPTGCKIIGRFNRPPSLAALLRTCLAQDSEAVVLEKYQSLEYTGILNMGLCVSEQRVKDLAVMES